MAAPLACVEVDDGREPMQQPDGSMSRNLHHGDIDAEVDVGVGAETSDRAVGVDGGVVFDAGVLVARIEGAGALGLRRASPRARGRRPSRRRRIIGVLVRVIAG